MADERLTTTQEAVPDAGGPSGLVSRKSEEEYVEDEYERGKKIRQQAEEIIEFYRQLGLRPCDMARVHAVIRASFGYHN